MGKPKKDTRPQTATGMNAAARLVQKEMACGWQPFAAENDNGVDALIIDRKDGIDTGAYYHAQVKCGDGYRKHIKKRPKHICISLGEKYLAEHRPRWNRLQGAVVLVYVDFKTEKAWWTDLKSKDSYCPKENKGLVLIPRNQRFGAHSLGALRRLRNFADTDREYPVVRLTKRELVIGPYTSTLKCTARAFYKAWAVSIPSERTNPRLGEVRVSRGGWRHISHQSRGPDNVCQSWGLLGAAKLIIRRNHTPVVIRLSRGSGDSSTKVVCKLVALRNRVIFPNRQEATVQVVVKQKQEISTVTGTVKTQNWFYSVHELRRAREQH